MKKLALLSIFLLSGTLAKSQGLPKNTLYVEAVGATYFYSVNYDYLLPLGEKFAVSGRIGGVYWRNSAGSDYTAFPLGLSALLKMKVRYVEIGVTSALARKHYDQSSEPKYEIKAVKLGIRSQIAGKHLFWSLHGQWSHVIEHGDDYRGYGWYPGAGATIGYSF